MRIHIDTFKTNNPELDFNEIITGIEAGVSESGIAHVRIETTDKYVDITTNGHISAPDYCGSLISVSPLIYDEELNYLSETDFDAYLAHPDYYRIALVVEMDMSCPTVKCTPLKYEYWINYIPHKLSFDYDVLKPIEVIGWEE